MEPASIGNRPPTPVVVLVVVALVVVALLLAQSAVGLLFTVIRFVLILVAFAAIGVLGLYLWRRGELRRPAS